MTSVRLGVEDFRFAQAEGGDEGRALSAVRNLFAGLLLLFKYRIVISAKDEHEGSKLIFKADTQPALLADGSVSWQPTKFKATTIDVTEIQSRFKVLGITTDWVTVNKLQEERNHIEHLYPSSGVGAVAQFVADAFPVLRDFIVDELEVEPADLLGQAWQVMLTHKKFFDKQFDSCQKAWESAGLPGEMSIVALAAVCEECGSPLVRPSGDVGESSDWDLGEHTYACEACGHHGDSTELLEQTLEELEGGYNPFDGGDPPTAMCPACAHTTFSHPQAKCSWCGYELQYTECVVGGERLSLAEQEFGGLCSYHHHSAQKHRDD